MFAFTTRHLVDPPPPARSLATATTIAATTATATTATAATATAASPSAPGPVPVERANVSPLAAQHYPQCAPMIDS